MIGAAELGRCHSIDALFDLLRTLAYPIEPIEIVAEEWRRAGIEIGWDDTLSLHLAARTRSADIYVTGGAVEAEIAARFLRSLQSYNVLIKPILICCSDAALLIFDLSKRRELRRLDVDLRHPSPHAIDRLNLLTLNDGADAARLFERALDREALTRQFFDRFRSSVRDAAASLKQSYPAETHDAITAEALLILSRILFLYFIQQKGWLNGERRFLVDRLDESVRSGREFFPGVLLPLFFGCLNTPVAERDATARSLGVVPYLNGGLFEPAAFERRHPDIHLSNELMRGIVEQTFERYAFTIDENDAGGMHIDPEMLGKVFESLMAADERAASGSFYTPRAIVDVLTERAIDAWLSDGLKPVPHLDRHEARVAMQRFERITVLDPACGSGAFLLSALSVIERRMGQLCNILEIEPPSRQAIMERSLFGVDLKPEAVRLCELRLWLAIVAKTNVAIESIPPLPNLDRNILQGNSLLSPTDFLGNARGDVYRQWLSALRAHADLVGRYRNGPQHERPALARLLRASDRRLATELLSKAVDRDEEELQQLSLPQRDLFGQLRSIDNGRCRELQQRIRDSRRTLDRLEEGEVDFFSFDVHFAHVMAGGGFDMVIGNPPWVRNSRIDPRAKRMYIDRYALFRGRGGAAFHQPDLSVVFFERALSLAAPHGVVSLLLPAKVMNAAYAAPLRRAAEAEAIVALDDWSDDARRHFDADTFPLGLTVSKAKRHRQVHVTSGGESFVTPQQSLTLSGSEWVLLPPAVDRILRRLHREHASLADVLDRAPVMGVKTGDNDSFFIDVKCIRGNTAETHDGIHIPLRYLCRCVRGRDIRRWQTCDPAWMLWPPPGGWIRIPRWLERFAELRGIDADDLNLAYVRSEHCGIKVVWKDVSRGIAAAVLRREMNGVPLIPNQTLYALPAKTMQDANALATLLNSTVVNALAVSVAERAKDFHYRYFGRTMARVPVPAAWSKLREARGEADRLVDALYGITPSEHSQLDRYVKHRLGYVVNDD